MNQAVVSKEALIKLLDVKNNDGYKQWLHIETPDPDDYDAWNSAILEARDRGISIKCFGDTCDKFVLTPEHLGYPFEYRWGKKSWLTGSWWNDDGFQDEGSPDYWNMERP